jgi:hypothetical protein
MGGGVGASASIACRAMEELFLNFDKLANFESDWPLLSVSSYRAGPRACSMHAVQQFRHARPTVTKQTCVPSFLPARKGAQQNSPISAAAHPALMEPSRTSRCVSVAGGASTGTKGMSTGTVGATCTPGVSIRSRWRRISSRASALGGCAPTLQVVGTRAVQYKDKVQYSHSDAFREARGRGRGRLRPRQRSLALHSGSAPSTQQQNSNSLGTTHANTPHQRPALFRPHLSSTPACCTWRCSDSEYISAISRCSEGWQWRRQGRHRIKQAADSTMPLQCSKESERVHSRQEGARP